MDLSPAKGAPGVLAVVTADSAGKLDKADRNAADLLGGPEVDHYHQAVAIVVAETFEQARAAASLIKVDYAAATGAFDLAAGKSAAPKPKAGGLTGEPDTSVGDFAGAFASAPIKLDATYSTPDHAHAMMEPPASTAVWEGDRLTLWTSNQMIDWGVDDVAKTLRIPKEKVRLVSPFIGGGFGGKLFVRADAILAALGARAAGRPVKVALQRPLIFNNTTHRPATIQRIRIGAGSDGKIAAIGHESWSGNLAGGSPETAVLQTPGLYARAHPVTAMVVGQPGFPRSTASPPPRGAPGVKGLGDATDATEVRTWGGAPR